MVYRIKLTGYTIYIWLLFRFIWLYDVFFTQVAIHQLRGWVKLKEYLDKLKTRKFRHIKDEISKGGLDSWD